MKKIVNGVEMDLTPEEIEEFNQRASEFEAQASDRMIQAFTFALEQAIDDKAKEKNYASTVSCVSYKDSTNAQWSAEAQAFIAWRDDCYTYAYNYLDQCESGVIVNPDIEDFISGLPALEWPTTQ